MSDETPPEHLERLLELQEIDSRIRRLEHRLDHLDEQQRLDKAREELDTVNERQAKLRVELDRVEAKQRQLEGELDLFRQRKDAEHARMYSGEISNPKELQSIRAEIESTERRISEHEDRLLAVMEKAEEIESRLDQLGEAEDELTTRVDELAAERDEAAQGLLAEKAELEVQRDRHRDEIADDLLARYDTKREEKGGVAVAELERGMCTGCRIELPMVDQQELFEGPPLGECPQCGRLLVVP